MNSTPESETKAKAKAKTAKILRKNAEAPVEAPPPDWLTNTEVLPALGLATKATATGERPTGRLVLTAWGLRFVMETLEFCLPALLSPNNLPAVAAEMDIELVFVTETKLFDFIKDQPVIAALRKICALRLVPLDDLVFPSQYGLTITLANFRGIADLGPKMVDHYLFFLFTDFICADGSLKTVMKKIAEGQRLIMAPSYQTLGDKMSTEFRARYDQANHSISIPPREMAGLILKNRHYLVRAKTINQRLFHCEIPEQFYWQVDENTLIGKQAPFALVCMRPEHEITAMDSFWDYGIVSEACPKTRICALTDSDDFCMAELQDPFSMHTVLEPGWPRVETSGQSLWFTSVDQRTCSQFTLYLHSQDLPAGVKEAERRLAAFIDESWKHAGFPAPHIDHPYWAGQNRDLRRYLEHKERFANLAEWDGVYKARFSGDSSRPLKTAPGGRIMRLYRWLVGTPPYVTKLHPLAPYLSKARELLDAEVQGRRLDVLLVTTPDHDGMIGWDYLSRIDGDHIRVATQTVGSPFFPDDFFGDKTFDLCFCELFAEDLMVFNDLYGKLRKHLPKGKKVIVFSYIQTSPVNGSYFHDNLRKFMIDGCPMIDESEIWFAGSRLRNLVIAWKRRAMELNRRKPWLSRLARIAAGAAGVAAVIYDNFTKNSAPSRAYHRDRMAVTMSFAIQ